MNKSKIVFVLLMMLILLGCNKTDKQNEIDKKEVQSNVTTTNKVEIENNYVNLIGKKSDLAFENQNFKKLLETIANESEREEISYAGWEEVEISIEGDFIIGSGFVGSIIFIGSGYFYTTGGGGTSLASTK